MYCTWKRQCLHLPGINANIRLPGNQTRRCRHGSSSTPSQQWAWGVQGLLLHAHALQYLWLYRIHAILINLYLQRCDQATRNIGTYNNAWRCRRTEEQRPTQTYLAWLADIRKWTGHSIINNIRAAEKRGKLEKEGDDIEVPNGRQATRIPWTWTLQNYNVPWRHHLFACAIAQHAVGQATTGARGVEAVYANQPVISRSLQHLCRVLSHIILLLDLARRKTEDSLYFHSRGRNFGFWRWSGLCWVHASLLCHALLRLRDTMTGVRGT